MNIKLTALAALMAALLPAKPSHGQSAASLQILNRSRGNLVRFDPQQDWHAFKQFRILPSAYEPANPEHGLKQSDVRKVTSALDLSIRSAFKNAPMAEGPVLEVRPVITDVKRTDTLLNVIGFALYQMPFSYGAAAVRFELANGATSKPIGEITCKRSARPWNIYPWNTLENFHALGQSSVILKSDAKRLRNDLIKLEGVPVVPSRTLTQGAE